MKRIRIHKPRARADLRWLEALPLEPRDPGIVRAKALAVVHRDHMGGSPGEGRWQ